MSPGLSSPGPCSPVPAPLPLPRGPGGGLAPALSPARVPPLLRLAARPAVRPPRLQGGHPALEGHALPAAEADGRDRIPGPAAGHPAALSGPQEGKGRRGNFLVWGHCGASVFEETEWLCRSCLCALLRGFNVGVHSPHWVWYRALGQPCTGVSVAGQWYESFPG